MMSLKVCIANFLETAKGFLLKDGSLSPVAIYVKNGEIVPVPITFGSQQEKEISYKVIQGCILKARPDFVVVITEAWLRIYGVEEHGEAEKVVANYVPGSVEKDPKRIEAITIVAGSVNGIEGMVQPFHRKGKKIIFDKPFEGMLGFESAFFGDVWSVLAAEERGDKVFH